MWACRMDNIEHFKLLSDVQTQNGADDEQLERDSNGWTWMHWAARRTDPHECLKVSFMSSSFIVGSFCDS